MKDSMQGVFDIFTYGIYLVTISRGDRINGMIASWVTQCSHEPPMVALAIRQNRLSNNQIKETKKLCINLLPIEAKTGLDRFKISNWKDKIDGVKWFCSPGGNPVIEESLGFLDLVLEKTCETGDHSIFICHAMDGGCVKEGIPLTTMDCSCTYRGKK
ncbi:MAG: flavin reductase family protein [Thermodesulfobacteriota bacterium]|nr:flavin reductase family protein [Thermodesulfobacteriota bacterium]